MTLLTRPAGYEVARACLDAQQLQPPRTRLQSFFGIDPVHPDAVSWFRGTLGEIQVGRVLERLGPEWTVIHAVPIGTRGSDIDHIVVGPAGVFTINTKRHRGKKVWVGDRRILVSGQKTDHLRNARFEAERASKLLSLAMGHTVPVSAMLVIVAAAEITIRSKPTDVTVLGDTQLIRWLKRRRPTLDAAAVATVTRAAVNPATWGPALDTPIDPGMMQAFATLQAQERTASTKRSLWMFAVLVAILAVAVPQLLGMLAGGVG